MYSYKVNIKKRHSGYVDTFAAAGLDKPDISILSDEFLAEVQGMPHHNRSRIVTETDKATRSHHRINVIIANITKIITSHLAISIENPAIPRAPNT